MRRRTALALGGVTAATALVLGLGGTTAVLSDSETVSAQAGAGSLSLISSVGDTPVELRTQTAVTIPLRAQVDGGAQVRLDVTLIGPVSDPCPEGVGISISVPGGTWDEKPVPLCDLVPGPTGQMAPNVLVLDEPAAVTELSLDVLATGEMPESTKAWAGDLRFTLQHKANGFSDRVDVAVLVPPAGVAEPLVQSRPTTVDPTTVDAGSSDGSGSTTGTTATGGAGSSTGSGATGGDVAGNGAATPSPGPEPAETSESSAPETPAGTSAPATTGETTG